MTTHWTFTDPITSEVWTVPINPDSMTSPEKPAKALQVARQGLRVATLETKPTSWSWDFSGAIRTQAHHDALADWAGRDHAVLISTHLGRQYRVFITDFEPAEPPKPSRLPWRMRYTMKTLILERVT